MSFIIISYKEEKNNIKIIIQIIYTVLIIDNYTKE